MIIKWSKTGLAERGKGRGQFKQETGIVERHSKQHSKKSRRKNNNTKLGLDRKEQKLRSMTEHLGIPDCVPSKGNQTEQASQAIPTGME